MKEKRTDIKKMTNGNPLRLLLFFALPLMFGNIFQQLYTVTDTAIVGRAVGVDALAALGAVEWFNWMGLGIVQGITQGFSILIAQNFGAKDKEHMKKAVGNSIALSVIGALVLLAFAQLFVSPALRFLNAPGAISAIAETYLRIMYAGIPIVTAYNMASSMLRACGDSKTPLYAMVIASLLNIGLDLLFVVVFCQGVAGAAVATLLAQAFSAVYCIVKIRGLDILAVSGKDLALDRALCKRLLLLGMPMAFQNMVISVGGMIVQSVVNGFGVVFIAGYTATTKLYGLLEIAAISYGYAMTTYAGQNMGAGKTGRISQGMKAGLAISMLTSIMVTCILFGCGHLIVGCFISPEAEGGTRALHTAVQYLHIMSIFLPVLYILHITRSCIQGMGNTVIPMVSGISEFIMRTGSAFVLPRFIGENGILYAEAIAWIGAVAILIPGYFMVYRKVKKG